MPQSNKENIMRYKIIAIVVLLMQTIISGCSNHDYKVYYVPLVVQFYVPPTPGDIVKSGYEIDMSSISLNELFDALIEGNANVMSKEDSMGLRIKIIRKNDGKVAWITAEKHVLSENNRYNTHEEIIAHVLEDIVKQSRLKYKKEWPGK
jgi:hypothetical protein